jgi:DNA polymerase III gamma/tau subunit
MSLYQKHRPTCLTDVIGNKGIVEVLQSMLEKTESSPHSFLLHGPTGCGKTTIGRIIASSLGAIGMDIKEIDSADFRGIDTIREIRKQCQYHPMQSACQVWLVDECFSKETMIATPFGEKRIDEIKQGDLVLSLKGIDQVKQVFKKQIPLDRFMKISFDNGTSLFCSDGHEFLTKDGWKHAKHLKNNDIIFPLTLSILSYIMGNINYIRRVKNEVQKMWQKHSHRTKILLKKMQQSIQWGIKITKTTIQAMSSLWNTDDLFFKSARKIQSNLLQYVLCGETSGSGTMFRDDPEKNIRETNYLFSNGKRTTAASEKLTKNESQQSFLGNSKSAESQRNEKNSRVSACLERDAWWEWNIDRTTEVISHRLGLDHGISDLDQTEVSLPILLQSGYSKSRIENSDRSGWFRSFITDCKRKRSKKGLLTPIARVESTSVYKPGDNAGCFKGIISDIERNSGFITLFDLEMKEHPSYFANKIAVHNCHKLTGDAQSALLKILEDTPKHVYFILCTTDPQKLLPTIKGRCSQFQVNPLTDREMSKLLRRVCREESASIEKEVYEQIIQDSLGHPRNALVILDQVLRVPVEKQLEAAQQTAAQTSQAIELCRALIGNQSWKTVSVILNGLAQQDIERTRKAVMGYCRSILLKGAENDRCAFIMETFKDPFFNNDFDGLVFACYSVVKG